MTQKSPVFYMVLMIFLFCGNGYVDAKAAQTPPSGKIFRFRIPFEPSSLDWNLGEIPISIIQNSMRGLYRVDAEGKIKPDLVLKAQVEDHQKKWTFHLKEGVQWSDGVPFTAEHAVDGLKRLLDPTLASSYAFFLYGIHGARTYSPSVPQSRLGIKVTSRLSFEILLDQPLPFLPSILTHWVTYPVRLDLISRWKDLFTRPEHLATLGPYLIQKWQHPTHLVLIPNPHYEGPKPWFQKIEAVVVEDDNTALNLYDTGYLQFMTEPGQVALRHVDLIQKPSPIVYFIGLGQGHPLTASRDGILALSAALDRNELPEALNSPLRPTLDFCPPEIMALLGSKRESVLASNRQESAARLLLKKAGYESAKTFPPLTLKFFNRPAIRQLAQWLQAQWKKHLGLEVRLEGEDPRSYWVGLSKTPAAVFVNSKGAGYPDPDAFFALFSPESAQNYGKWQDSDFDRWLLQARGSPLPAERAKIYQKMSKRLLDEHPALIPLYFRSTDYLIKPYVKGIVINPLTSVDFTQAHY